MKLKYITISIICLLLSIHKLHAQFTNGITGLLHMPNAEIQKDATFILGGNLLNRKNLPSDHWWGHDTYNYFVNITLFDRIEVSYICTLVQGKNNGYWPQQTWGKFTNQDRHFAGKIQLVKEGEWWNHMPAIAVGVNDPTTGVQNDGYHYGGVGKIGNGFFNRRYIAVTKHFNIKDIGELGIHATYLYNKRIDYPLNGPAFGVNFRSNIHKNLNLIAEYDAKTINVGAIYSLWTDHFNFLFELQEGKYISAGLVYKVNLKGGNKWNSKILE